MPPVSLSDEEFSAVRAAAGAVPYSGRDEFLRRVAAELESLSPPPCSNSFTRFSLKGALRPFGMTPSRNMRMRTARSRAPTGI